MIYIKDNWSQHKKQPSLTLRMGDIQKTQYVRNFDSEEHAWECLHMTVRQNRRIMSWKRFGDSEIQQGKVPSSVFAFLLLPLFWKHEVIIDLSGYCCDQTSRTCTGQAAVLTAARRGSMTGWCWRGCCSPMLAGIRQWATAKASMYWLHSYWRLLKAMRAMHSRYTAHSINLLAQQEHTRRFVKYGCSSVFR